MMNEQRQRSAKKAPIIRKSKSARPVRLREPDPIWNPKPAQPVKPTQGNFLSTDRNSNKGPKMPPPTYEKEPVHMAKLISMDYQRDWVEQNAKWQETQKLKQPKYVPSYSKKDRQVASAKGRAKRYPEPEKEMFKLSRFKKVPSKLTGYVNRGTKSAGANSSRRVKIDDEVDVFGDSHDIHEEEVLMYDDYDQGLNIVNDDKQNDIMILNDRPQSTPVRKSETLNSYDNAFSSDRGTFDSEEYETNEDTEELTPKTTEVLIIHH